MNIDRPTGNLMSPETTERHVKSLMIDDEMPVINLMKSGAEYYKWKDFTAFQCHSVESATQKIKEIMPDILFLDHNIGDMGSEGLIIAKEAIKINPNIKLYSTTDDFASASEDYRENNIEIEHVDKWAIKIIGGIIDEAQIDLEQSRV